MTDVKQKDMMLSAIKPITPPNQITKIMDLIQLKCRSLRIYVHKKVPTHFLRIHNSCLQRAYLFLLPVLILMNPGYSEGTELVPGANSLFKAHNVQIRAY